MVGVNMDLQQMDVLSVKRIKIVAVTTMIQVIVNLKLVLNVMDPQQDFVLLNHQAIHAMLVSIHPSAEEVQPLIHIVKL